MIAVSLCGYLPFYAALTMLLAFSVNVRAGASLIVLLVLTGALTDAAKIVVSYPRPDVVDPRVQALAPMRLITASAGNVALGDHLPAPVRAIVNGMAAHAPTMSSEDAYGFPSGHVANAVAFVCGLVFLFRWQAAWMAAALWIPLMALSRMYLGRHFFADVIGGLAAGLVATMIVVRALNLQRLHDQGQRRVLIKTVALAVLCALLAIGGAIPPVYESGRLLGAAVALVVVSRAAPIEYDHAPAAVKAARLGAAALIFALTWWVTSGWLVPITARTSLATLVIGALPIAALIPAPVLLERVLRR